MVLDMHREPLHAWIKSGAVRHRPAHQHAIDLEPQVVVKAPGPMPLHNKTALAAVRFFLRAGRLRGPGEIALGPVPPEFRVVPGHDTNSRTPRRAGQVPGRPWS